MNSLMYARLKRRFAKQWPVFCFLMAALLLLPTMIKAQTMNMGKPKSWSEQGLENTPSSFIVMPSFELAAIQTEDEINDTAKDRPWRFGYEHEVNINILDATDVHTIPGEGTIYRVGITSLGAKTINLVFSAFNMPVGASLHLYSANRKHVIGAYTYENNHPSGQLGTDLVTGDQLIVEYFEPIGNIEYPELTISHVVHGYRSPFIYAQNAMKSLNDSGDCNQDVGCPAGNGWGDQIRSVGLLLTGGGTCSGAMINNTSNDRKPYFLTARHCGSSYGSWVVRFNWESTVPVCASTDNSVDPGPPYDETINGATFRATNSGSDFTLVELDNLSTLLMGQWNIYLAGWDRSDVAPSNSTGIHHPSGDVKKICRDNNAATKNTISFNGDGMAMMWRIADWDVGVTEPGSSGSPLFDQNKRIIGQLCCGAAACSGTDDNDSYDHYGRFGVSWSGPDASSRLSDWLDPTNSGATAIDGIDPIPANDLCANAQTVSCGIVIAGSTANATESDAPSICTGGGLPNEGVWFRFVGTGDIVTFSTTGSSFDTQLNVYEGSCGALNCIGGDDDSGNGTTSSFTFCSQNGVTYYIYVDGFGAATGTYQLNVGCIPDTTDPVVSCPSNLVLTNDPGTCSATFVVPLATASDNCGVTVLRYRWRPTNENGINIGPYGSWTTAAMQTLDVGYWRIQWEAKDAANNKDRCSFRVTIEDNDDPVVTCNGLSFTVPNDPGFCSANLDLPIPPATDNCEVETLEYRYRSLNENGTPVGPWSAWTDESFNNVTLDVGSYRIRWRATDPSGNTDHCRYVATVEDVEPPMIDCFNQTIVFNGQASIPLLVDDLAAATDNCGIASLTLNINEIFCEQLGEEIMVTATAVDIYGLENSCIAIVTVDGLPCGWSQQPDGVGCEDGNDVDYDVPTETFSVNSDNCHNSITTDTDEFAFAQYNLCGNGSITAQVTSIIGTSNGWAGVIMRESNDPVAKSVAMTTNLSSNHRREVRNTTGGNVTSQLSPAFNRHWLRIIRLGNSFRIYASSNGSSWFLRSSQTVSMQSCIEVGLVVNGYVGANNITATFENVVVEGATFYELQANLPTDELAHSQKFKVYPNPTAGQVIIELGDFLNKEGRLEVLDLNGKLVQLVREGIFEYSTEELNLGQLPTGLYFVRLQLADGTVQTQRVIVQPRS